MASKQSTIIERLQAIDRAAPISHGPSSYLVTLFSPQHHPAPDFCPSTSSNTTLTANLTPRSSSSSLLNTSPHRSNFSCIPPSRLKHAPIASSHTAAACSTCSSTSSSHTASPTSSAQTAFPTPSSSTFAALNQC